MHTIHTFDEFTADEEFSKGKFRSSAIGNSSNGLNSMKRCEKEFFPKQTFFSRKSIFHLSFAASSDDREQYSNS